MDKIALTSLSSSHLQQSMANVIITGTSDDDRRAARDGWDEAFQSCAFADVWKDEVRCRECRLLECLWHEVVPRRRWLLMAALDWSFAFRLVARLPLLHRSAVWFRIVPERVSRREVEHLDGTTVMVTLEVIIGFWRFIIHLHPITRHRASNLLGTLFHALATEMSVGLRLKRCPRSVDEGTLVFREDVVARGLFRRT